MPTKSPTSDRHLHRLALGAAAVLPEAQAIALLPMNDGEARRWLRYNDLVHDLEGRRVVVWGEVLEAITKSDAEPNTTATRKNNISAPVLRRAKLEPIR
jgi:hypothetical protein